MEIVIDIDSSIPDFARFWLGLEVAALVDEIRRKIAGGEPSVGEALPSARQLAADLRIDVETVAKSYRLLEGEGVLRSDTLGRVFVRRCDAAPAARAPATR